MNLRFSMRAPLARRAVFLSVNILAAACVYFLVVDPVRRWMEGRAEDIAGRRMTLSRYEAVSAQERAVQDFAKQVADSNARGELIAGATSGIVNANLQARLKSLAEAAKVTVRSIQMLPIKTLRGAALVGAKLEVVAPVEPLHRLARALEGEPPLLLVTAATLRGQPAFWGPVAAKSAPEEQNIDAQFEVYGGALSKETP
jgi:hypothetical protein